MIKYFSKAFRITNENIILATPLVFFLFVLSVYLEFAQRAPKTIPSAILLLITTLFMISAFFAGWLYMVKKAVDLDQQEFILEEDRAKSSFGLMKEIPVGIGEYFLPFIGGILLYSTLSILFGIAVYKIGMNFIGDVGLSAEQIKALLSSPEAVKMTVKALSKAQLIKLQSWNTLLFISLIAYSFLTMFWGVEVIMRTKNPFWAFFRSIKTLFQNFLPAVILFVYISFTNFIVSFINTLATVNPILYFVSMLIYFYFLVYVVVLIFLYYDREITGKKEDNFAQDNSDSGTDSKREEQPRD